MSKGTGTISWKTAFSISAVLFGFHVGGGFASGSQTMNFFVKFGWTALFFPVVAIIIQNLVFRSGFFNAQMNGSSHYREWTDAAYYPAQKFFSNFYEFANLILIVLTISACTAGAGSLLEGYGVPYIAGIILISLAFVLLSIFGKELVAKASTVMTILIVVGMLTISIFGLLNRGSVLSEMAKPANAPLGFGASLWSMLQYAGYQTYCVATLCPYAASMKNKAGIRRTLTINVILNGAILGISAITLLAWLPELGGQTLPFIYIIKQTGQTWLEVLYAVSLLCAFVSTAIGCLIGMITRYEGRILTSVKITARRAIIAILAIVVSALVSLVGLDVIVRKGYAYMGIIGIFLMIIPTLTIVAYRNAKGIITRKKADGEKAAAPASAD